MGKQPETIFKEKVFARLNEMENLWFFKVHLMSLAGIPDVIGCKNGRFFAWELKKDEKSRPSKLQSFILEKISLAGGHTQVVFPENLDSAIDTLRTLGV